MTSVHVFPSPATRAQQVFSKIGDLDLVCCLFDVCLIRSSGKQVKSREEDEETFEERQQNRSAATDAVEFSAELARKAVAHSAQLRQQAWEEKQRMHQDAKKGPLTFNQKARHSMLDWRAWQLGINHTLVHCHRHTCACMRA